MKIFKHPNMKPIYKILFNKGISCFCNSSVEKWRSVLNGHVTKFKSETSNENKTPERY